jgi:hypothetical protein
MRSYLEVQISRLPVALLILFIAGCGHKSPMAHVRGKVVYKDGTVPMGGMCVVRFQPTESSTATVRKGASGDIHKDGTFEAWTRIPGDGVYLGEYGVSFAVWTNATDPSSSVLLPKYGSPATTGLKVTVDGDIDDLKFEIERSPGGQGKPAAGGAPASNAGGAKGG